MTEETPSTKILMIDIETLDTAPTAVILQIAVSVWDGVSEPIVKSWNINSECQPDRTVSIKTVEWWMNQIKNGAEVTILSESTFPLASALHGLSHYISHFNSCYPSEIWSQGNFDIAILSDAYDRLSTFNPLGATNYSVFRDLRTLTHSIPREEYEKLKVNPTNPHNAESDCMAQMKTLINIKNYLSHEH